MAARGRSTGVARRTRRRHASSAALPGRTPTCRSPTAIAIGGDTASSGARACRDRSKVARPDTAASEGSRVRRWHWKHSAWSGPASSKLLARCVVATTITGRLRSRRRSRAGSPVRALRNGAGNREVAVTTADGSDDGRDEGTASERRKRVDGGLSRRDALRRFGIAAGVAWTAPVVMSLYSPPARRRSAHPARTTTTTAPARPRVHRRHVRCVAEVAASANRGLRVRRRPPTASACARPGSLACAGLEECGADGAVPAGHDVRARHVLRHAGVHPADCRRRMPAGSDGTAGRGRARQARDRAPSAAEPQRRHRLDELERGVDARELTRRLEVVDAAQRDETARRAARRAADPRVRRSRDRRGSRAPDTSRPRAPPA